MPRSPVAVFDLETADRQRISVAFLDVNSVKFADSAKLKIRFKSVLRRHIYVAKCKWKRFNKSNIRSEETHVVTRCKQAERE